jgi:hypothetical protein
LSFSTVFWQDTRGLATAGHAIVIEGIEGSAIMPASLEKASGFRENTQTRPFAARFALAEEPRHAGPTDGFVVSNG